MNISHKFINDLDAEILVPNDHPLYITFVNRINSEKYFRIIHSYLFLHKIISGNILDSGCWIGDNSIPWSKITNNTIYAIDPSPKNCDFIKLVSTINQISNLEIHTTGLSRYNTQLSTNYDIDHAPFSYGSDGANIIESVSIDYLENTGKIQNLSCIHLDVEGMEYEVICGSDNTIKKYKPIISFEQHIETDDYRGLSQLLNTYNYHTFMINEYLHGCRQDCRNFISFPKDVFSDKLLLDINTYCSTKNILLNI